MKKNRFIALALAAGMTFCNVAATGVVALADVPTSQTISSDSAADEQTGKYTISVKKGDSHTYTVYQVLTGTLIAGQEKLGDPKWGANASKTARAGKETDFITAIKDKSGVALAEEVAKYVDTTTKAIGTVSDSESGSLDVAPGYYMIIDTTEFKDEKGNLKDVFKGDSRSLNIVAVFNDIQITPKKGTVVSEKHVDDQNDSDTTDYSELKDSADYDIGDSIPYTLTMKLPEDYANFKQYYVSFVDDMSAGLTYNGDAKIYYGDADETGDSISFASDTSMTSAYTGGTVYRATIQNLKADDAIKEQQDLAAGSVITIKYTATLNSNAVIGSAGNPNKYRIDYSSNPNQEADGEKKPETNDTPWDTNIVFTYKTVFNKVDADQKPLTGADFRLDKFVADKDGADTYGDGEAAIKGTWTDVTTLGTTAHPTKTTEDVKIDETNTAANAKFTFSGLDAGVYRLTETTTPAGYNTIDPVTFTITAEHELVAENPKLTALSGVAGAEFTLTADKADGSLTSNVVNKQGAILPSTGGIGTTILYVIGGILVIGGGAAIFIKRKKDAE